MPDADLRSKIRVIPGFLDAAECAALRAELDTMSGNARPAGISGGQPATLDPAFWPGDITDARRMLQQARLSDAGRFILARYGFAESDAESTGTVVDLSDADFHRALPILTRIVNDPGFYPAIASRITLPEGSQAAAELDELLRAGALVRAGDGFRESDGLSSELALALSWFNARLLEEVIFPGSIDKSSRLLRRDVAPESFLARLESVPAGHPGSAILDLLRERFPDIADTLARRTRASFLSAFRRILWAFEVQTLLLDLYRDAALKVLFTRPDRDDHRFDALRCREKGPALRAAGGSYPRCRAVHAMLHLFFPGEVQPPAPPGMSTHVRDARIFENPELVPRIEAIVRRLAHEHAQPSYGIHIEGNPVDTQILRYTAGGHYVQHVDAETPVIDAEGAQHWVKNLPRDLSVVIYLSREADFSGGALHFPGLCTIAPTEGMAVMFPSDHRFPHAAEPVTRGTRDAIVSFLQCTEGRPVGERHQVNW